MQVVFLSGPLKNKIEIPNLEKIEFKILNVNFKAFFFIYLIQFYKWKFYNKVNLPTVDTYYHCEVFEIPKNINKKKHVVKVTIFNFTFQSA